MEPTNVPGERHGLQKKMTPRRPGGAERGYEDKVAFGRAFGGKRRTVMLQVSMAYLIWPQVPLLFKKAGDWRLLPATEGQPASLTLVWQ